MERVRLFPPLQPLPVLDALEALCRLKAILRGDLQPLGQLPPPPERR